MTLDSLNVPFTSVDITVRENEQEREFMRENAVNSKCTTDIPLPPQIFFKEEYLGVSLPIYYSYKIVTVNKCDSPFRIIKISMMP